MACNVVRTPNIDLDACSSQLALKMLADVGYRISAETRVARCSSELESIAQDIQFRMKSNIRDYLFDYQFISGGHYTACWLH